MQNKFDNMTLALAGIIQPISLIKELAQTGKLNEAAFQTSINSLFQTDPENVAAVFGETAGLEVGLEKLILTLNSMSDTSRVTTRYLLSLIGVEKKISCSKEQCDILKKRLAQAKKQVDYFSLIHPTVIANLADIYITIVSPFRFKFLILGNPKVLNVDANMEKIRALLLTAIRASVLWRQLGGSRLQLLFSRAKIKNSAMKILAEILHSNKEKI